VKGYQMSVGLRGGVHGVLALDVAAFERECSFKK
jgi:hypothetical protein